MWHEILISTIDPLIIDYRPAVSNEHSTLEYIPATRLRGALFEFLDQIAPGVEAAEMFGNPNRLWSPAWPQGESGKAWLPTPKSESRSKVRSVMWYQWDGAALRVRAVSTENNMSVGRHYGRRAHRNSALYAREAICPGQRFCAVADLPISVKTPKPLPLSIGTRRSANGSCTVDIWPLDCFPDPFGKGQGCTAGLPDRSAVVQLVSDAIIPGPSGGYYRGLDSAAFSELAQFDIEVVRAASSSRIVSGWSGLWGLPREAALAIEAGSIWWIRASNSREAQLFGQFVANVASAGLGIRGHEGFGWVVVNPPWINVRAQDSVWKATISDQAEPSPLPPPEPGHPLPGFGKLKPSHTSALIERAKVMAPQILRGGLAPQYCELVQYAKRRDVVWVSEYIAENIKRAEKSEDAGKERKWRDFRNTLALGIPPADDPKLEQERVLFYWVALETELQWLQEREKAGVTVV